MSAPIFIGTAFERTGISLLARVTDADGNPITKASVDAIYYDIWKIPMTRTRYQQLITAGSNVLTVPIPATSLITVPELIEEDISLDPDDVLFDSLQNDDMWTVDDVGYNFRVQIPPEQLPAINISAFPDPEWQSFSFTLLPLVVGTGEVPFVAWEYYIAKQHRLQGKAIGTGS